MYQSHCIERRVLATLTSPSLTELVNQAIGRTVDRLFTVQQDDGSWRDHTSSSALATGVSVLSLHFADRRHYSAELRQGCEWLRQTQHPDGGWGDAVVDLSNLNSTTFALAALKTADADRSAWAIERGLAFLETRGGLAAVGDRRRCSLSPIAFGWLALAGLADWDDVQRLPVEMALLPRRVWQRVAFTVPAVFSLGLMHARVMRLSVLRRWLVRLAEPQALAYLRLAQGTNGGYQESPLLNGTVYVALNRAGCGEDIADRCLAYLLETRRPDGSWSCERDLELSVTTYILEALEAAGCLAHERLRPTVAWLLAGQHDVPFPPTNSPAGAWSWGRPSGWPDTDDTAGALLMLRRMGVPSDDAQLRLGYAWLEAMQNRDGSWGMFVKDSRVTIDRPCPALTARVAMALHERGRSPSARLEQALRYLGRAQRPDGSIPSLWFLGSVYGTAQALDAYAAIGRADDPVAHGCRGWLLANQNEDGSWGSDPAAGGTAEETGWALAALAAEGVSAPLDRLDRAAIWLVDRQRDDGTWAPAVIGIYYLSLVYSSDHITTAAGLRALARHRRQRSDRQC
jgi:squalene-hopene/tetraprenyl-beta-curcumene cyclase